MSLRVKYNSTTTVGPRLTVLDKISERLERVRDSGLRYGSVSIKLTYRDGVPREEIEVTVQELC